MSLNARTISLAAAAVLLAGAAVYTLLPGDRDAATLARHSVNSGQAAVLAGVTGATTAASTQSAGETAVQSNPAAVQSQPGALNGPPKLTKQQLTPPPPANEGERLQKAAEQEYDRF